MIFVCFGVPRSASSYTFQIVEGLARADATSRDGQIIPVDSFAPDLSFYVETTEDLSTILQKAPSAARGDEAHCVLKTHIAFDDRDVGLLMEGTAIIVNERPLEQCAASLVESYHEQMARTGQTEFPCGASLIDTARMILSADAYGDVWRSLPHMIVNFAEVIHDPASVANKIASKFNLRAAGSEVVDEIKNIWQLRRDKMMKLPTTSRDLIKLLLAELSTVSTRPAVCC